MNKELRTTEIIKCEPAQLPAETCHNIPGYDGFYQASNLGRVRGVGRVVEKADGTTRTVAARILTPTPDADGYLRVRLSKDGNRKHFVHRLVALAFIGDAPPNHEVHHRNGNIADNQPGNLVYMPKSLHRSIHNRGDKNPQARLTAVDVINIRGMIARGKTNAEIAAHYGVTHSTISCIRRGKTWRHLPSIGRVMGGYPLDRHFTFADIFQVAA